MTFLTIIIPVKNRKELLSHTLKNILSQTMVPDEIIIIDDGSTDGLKDFISNKYKTIVQIIQNGGKGPGAARNTGLKHSQGEFVKFFDSDDVMTKNCLENQYTILKNTSSNFVYGPYIHAFQISDYTWKQKDVIIQYKPLPIVASIHAYMVRGFFMCIPACMFKRSFIEKVGPWREDITAYEDWDYLWRIAQLETSPVHTNKSAMFYRVHENQITGNQFNNQQRDIDKIKCLTKILNDYSENLSYVQKSMLQAQILKTLVNVRDIPGYFQLYQQYNSIQNRLFQKYLRIENKFGRIRTKSSWQPFHGINKNPKQFEDYLSLL